MLLILPEIQHIAARDGIKEIAKELIDQGADPSAVDQVLLLCPGCV